jgi:hypothetical protein
MEKLEAIGRVADAVERATNGEYPCRRNDARNHWKVLQIVRAGVGVAGIVGRPASVGQVNAEAGISENGISKEGVAAATGKGDAAATVICDQVGIDQIGTADG